MKLTAELSEKQLDTIERALDLYSRILCGQIEEVHKVIQWADFDRSIMVGNESRAIVETATSMLKQALFPEIYPASYSICNTEKLPSTAAVAYDIYQTLRKLNGEKRAVFKTSKDEALPIIEKE